MSEPELRVLPDADAVAAAAADALIQATVDAQTTRGSAHLVLTGGGVGIAMLAALRDRPNASDIDWHRVDLWWGDERYLPEGDPERNVTQARAALLDHLSLDPAHVHPMPAAGDDAGAAALAYADALAAHAGPGLAVPHFDVLLLGMGPEGHIASLFPHSPGVHSAVPVVPVYECPKPPPTRISLTLPSIRAARAVWIVTAGSEKAEAIAKVMDPTTDPIDVPAAGARGQDETLVWVDRAAASLLPS